MLVDDKGLCSNRSQIIRTIGALSYCHFFDGGRGGEGGGGGGGGGGKGKL